MRQREKESSGEAFIEMDGKKSLKNAFLAAILLLLEIDAIPTHCLIVAGYRVSSTEPVDGTREAVDVLGNTLESLFPDLLKYEPHKIDMLARKAVSRDGIVHTTRFYS